MPWGMSFKTSEVKTAIGKVREAVPDAIIENHMDYGFTCAVGKADRTKGCYISQVVRDEEGKYLDGYLANDEEIDLIIKDLKE